MCNTREINNYIISIFRTVIEIHITNVQLCFYDIKIVQIIIHQELRQQNNTIQ